MRYENSLTNNVQNYIAKTLAKKVQEAQSGWELGNVARDIRSYLCDQSSLSTPDFVIRRFLQANQSAILPTGVNIPNLLENKNLPWPVDVLKTLSSTLAAHSSKVGTNIEKKTWFDYLAGNRNPQNREMVFRIAFSINMDVETTIDLLLASDLEPYSARYPLDLICLFCQRVPGKYTWNEVLAMLDTFMQKGTAGYIGKTIPTAGMTRQISSALDAIFEENLGDADAKEALIRYMISNSSEFPCYKKTVTRACRDADGKIIYDIKEVKETGEDGCIRLTEKKVTRKETRVEPHYIEGFSSSRMNCFIRLTEYLAILFPCYGNPVTPLDLEDDGSPKLQSLVRSMFFNCELAEIFPKDDSVKKEAKKVSDSTKRTPAKNSLTESEKFNEVMRQLLQNYDAHMTAVSKLREYLSDAYIETEQAREREKDDFVSFFTRQDALFLIYFFIIGYRNLLSRYYTPEYSNYSEWNPKENKNFPCPAECVDRIIKDMCWSGDPFDEAIALVISNIDFAYFDCTEADATVTQFNYLKECFDLLLAQMDYINLYLPARFDRFVILSLLSASPSELTPLIMCQSELDFYEKSI